MKLYTSPASPFVRKVRALILELGLEARVEAIPASGTATATGSLPLDKNPLGKIPTLLRDDGLPLYDSRVICRYLDDLAGGGLYPQDRLWDVLTLEAAADGMMEAAVLMVYESRLRPEENRFLPWVEAQWAKIDRTLTALEAGTVPCLGKAAAFDMGQIALSCALGYLDFRHSAREWRQGRPALAAWQAEMALRPCLSATVPVG